jgi:uncharacterized protein YjgD (DUF1641 family)
MSNTDATIKILKDLINEVTEEAKSGIITESVEPAVHKESEEKILKEFVTRKVVKVLKESGD